MKKIILFGDSITYGYNGDNPAFRFDDYQINLQQNLEKMGMTDVKLIVRGVPGDDTRHACLRFEKDVLNEHPDFAVIFFGANDAAIHHEVTPEQYAENLAFFAKKLGLTKTILVTPPFYDESKGAEWRNNEQIELFRAELLRIAESFHIKVVDLYSAMIHSPAPCEFLQNDGLHFNQHGYELLASLVATTLKGI